MRHVKSYLNGTSIINLARKCNYPPSMMARLIVENVVAFPPPSKNSNKNTANNNIGKDIHNEKKQNDINRATNSNSVSSDSNNTTNNKKFATIALRHPEKILGNASRSILPEYLFSERNDNTIIEKQCQLIDNFSGLPLDYDKQDEEKVVLSRLSLEVREAIDSDPMYGKKSVATVNKRFSYHHYHHILFLVRKTSQETHYHISTLRS